MATIDYPYEFNYRDLPIGEGKTSSFPSLEIILRSADLLEVPIIPIIDSGAAYSLFSFEIGSVLGLSVDTGTPLNLATLGGPLRAYKHLIELEIAYAWNLGRIYVLFADQQLPRELLGRDFLDHVHLGLWQRAQKIYLRPA